jgi:hypothetical protein
LLSDADRREGTKVRLVRLVIVRLSRNGESGDWHWTRQFDDVRVEARPLGDPQKVIVFAEIELPRRPEVCDRGLILVPEFERRQLEQAIERSADLLAVARRCGRRIISARPEAALRDLDEADRDWLAGVSGFAITGVGRIGVDSSMSLLDLPVHALEDRHDGVQLLAESLSSDHETGRFRELCRVMERAFGLGPFNLIGPLTKFLAHFAAFDYRENEVTEWLTVLRSLATHADRREQFATAADVIPALGRIEQAAYDVLLNKANWRSADTDRRAVWTPVNGVLRDNGAVQLVTHTGYIYTEVLDAFGVYPFGRDFRVAVPEDWYAVFGEREHLAGTLTGVDAMTDAPTDPGTQGGP